MSADWRQRRIGDLARVVGGGTPSTGVDTYWHGSIPWFTPTEISQSGAGEVTCSKRMITPDGLENSGAKLLPPGTVLVTSRASIGNCAIAGVPVTTNQGFASLVPHDLRSSRFLYYWIQMNQNRLLGRAAGSTFSEISADELSRVDIEAPDLETQARIGSVLMDADAAIASLRGVILKKERLDRALASDLLSGRTRLPDFDSPWNPMPMRALGTLYGGLTGKSKEDFGAGSAWFVPFMAVISSARVGTDALLSVRVGSTERQHVVKAGDLLFNVSSETPDELAMCAVAGELPANAYLNSFCFGFRLRGESAEPFFLARLFRSGVGRTLMRPLAQGATRYNLARPQFAALEVQLPGLGEQREIAAVLLDAEMEMVALQRQLTKLQVVRRGMMQELLNGRTRVPLEEPTNL